RTARSIHEQLRKRGLGESKARRAALEKIYIQERDALPLSVIRCLKKENPHLRPPFHPRRPGERVGVGALPALRTGLSEESRPALLMAVDWFSAYAWVKPIPCL